MCKLQWPKSVMAISICSRQFQFIHGNFNLLTAISICSRQFQFAHGNSHGIFRFAHHPSVVIEMGILSHTSNISKSKSKIPDYARDYRNEYLFIRGINKTCENFVKKLGREEVFKSPQAVSLMRNFNKFLKAQQLGYLNDTSEISFKYKDVISIESLELQLDDYRDLYCDEYSYQFDEEKYNNNNIENDYPGFKKFFECFSRFQDKLNVDHMSEEDYYKSKIIWPDSDSDDDGLDSDDINNILSGCEDSESDSDSD